MTKAAVTNVGASVRQRLLNLSRERHEDFNLVLSLYAIERLLYRLAQSPFAGQFVLKGAVLFTVWTGRLHRPTHDLDLLGYGDNSADTLTEVFQTICQINVPPDGIMFDAESIRVSPIREEQEYGGQRIELKARLDTARISVQIDIGSGDAITPVARMTRYPTLLDFPEPELRAYPKETVVAEKLHAMATQGALNSRMKDFYDLWLLSRQFDFEGTILARAIQATFDRRQTPLSSDTPLALTETFSNNADKVTQWKAFLRRNQLDVGEAEFTQIVADLAEFLEPPRKAAATGSAFEAVWPAAGPWSAR